MNFEKFYNTYLQEGNNSKDEFHETINVLPFTSNPSTSNFDSSCGLKGITGEFFRKCSSHEIIPITDYKKDASGPVIDLLSRKKSLLGNSLGFFQEIMDDIMSAKGEFVPFDASFLKYMALDTIEKKGKRVESKYGNGQKKIAEYLVSMLNGESIPQRANSNNNLFSKTIRNALDAGTFYNLHRLEVSYKILPFVQKTFREDLSWLMGKEDYVLIKYIDLFLYFYACYSITQSAMMLDAENKKSADINIPEPLYFILDKEVASAKRDVVTKGWATKLPNEYLERLYGRMQALDIANTLLANNDNSVFTGFYPEVLQEMNKTPFEDVKSDCEKLLEYYKTRKLDVLNKRENRKAIDLSIFEDLTVNSYEEFLTKLEKLCRVLQATDYCSKMRRRMIDLMQVRFLQTRRGRGHTVLTLDDEMLIFLIAMITKEKRTKLKDIFKSFRNYGIYFDLHTCQAIEDYLSKLNLLERRSDSGEAKYVRIVL